MALGDPPNYSTPRTLGLAAASFVGALSHFGLGAAEYSRMGRFVGLWEMILAALLLVFGVLTTIRFAEAQDALSDPNPRTPMYATPHEWLTFWVGLGVNGTALLLNLYWMARQELSVWHAVSLAFNLLGVWLAWHIRPRPDDF